MQVGDEILAVNENRVNRMKYDEVMQLLHTTLEPVEFQVTKAEVFTTTTTGSSSVQSACGSSEPSRVGSPSPGQHKQHHGVNLKTSSPTKPSLETTKQDQTLKLDQPEKGRITLKKINLY
jgi:hypothetical protein